MGEGPGPSFTAWGRGPGPGPSFTAWGRGPGPGPSSTVRGRPGLSSTVLLRGPGSSSTAWVDQAKVLLQWGEG